MDKFTGDDLWFSFSMGFVIGAIIISVIGLVFIAPDEQASGWYDALCDGEVISVEAGTACLTDGKVELLEEYK
jgi:hypothetical protein